MEVISIFEVVATGLGKRFLKGQPAPVVDQFVARHKNIWGDESLKGKMGSGVRASTRIPNTVAYGEAWLGS